jgi:DNA-binding HxlR family transcriptional regulator
MRERGTRNEELIHKETLSPCMAAILSALRESEELRYTDLKSKLINPEKNKPYTDRALSLNLDSLEKRGLVERPVCVGHRPYHITVKGVEEILKAEDCSFIQKNNFYKAFDIGPYAPIPPPLRSSRFGYADERIDRPDSRGRLENLETPEEIVSDYQPIFPLSTRAVVKLSENGKLALEP